MAITNLLLVGIGGFFGAIARFSISKYLNNKTKYPIPMGTLTVNLLGSFLLGILIGAKADVMFVLLFGTGFMGAFTTFSTLKFEMTEMYVHKNKRKLLLYTVLTYGLGLILAYAGYWIGNSY